MAIGDQGLNRFRSGLQAVQANNERLNPLFGIPAAQTSPSGLQQAAVRNQLLADAAQMSAPAARAMRFPVAAIGDDIIQQALLETHTMPAPATISEQLALPAAGQTTTGTGPVSARVARAQSILAGNNVLPPRFGSGVATGGRPAIGSALANTVDDLVLQAASVAPGQTVPVASTAAPTAAASVANATGAAARTGFLGRLAQARAGQLPWQTLTGGGARGVLGAVGRASIPLTAGLMAGGLIDSVNIGGENSGLDRFLSGAAPGAGIGAAVGSVVPVVGTGLGAAIGGVGGGLYKMFSGDSTTKDERIRNAYTGTKDVIQNMGAQYGLSPDTMQNIMLEFDIAANLMMEQGDEEGLQALVDNLEATLPATIMQYRMEEEQTRRQNERMLAIQTQFAPIFQSITGNAQMNSGVAYEQALNAADSLESTNPQLAALVRSNAASSRQSSDAMMAAYASQAAIGMATGLEQQFMMAQDALMAPGPTL